MNIYKTKDGQYINMNMVQYVGKDDDSVEIWFEMKDKIELYNDAAKAFLEYLDTHLEGVYAGSA